MKTKDESKTKRLTISLRISDNDTGLLERVQQLLTDPYRGKPNVTDTIIAALRIAEENLKKNKHTPQ
jgi:hypothetical protein